MESMV